MKPLRAYKVRVRGNYSWNHDFKLVYGLSLAHALRIAHDMGWEPRAKGHNEVGAIRPATEDE